MYAPKHEHESYAEYEEEEKETKKIQSGKHYLL